MGSAYHFEPIGVIELFSHILTKGVSRPSGTDTPASSVIRVRPQQVAHRPFMGHFAETVQVPNVVQRVGGGGKSAMEAEILVFY